MPPDIPPIPPPPPPPQVAQSCEVRKTAIRPRESRRWEMEVFMVPGIIAKLAAAGALELTAGEAFLASRRRFHQLSNGFYNRFRLFQRTAVSTLRNTCQPRTRN